MSNNQKTSKDNGKGNVLTNDTCSYFCLDIGGTRTRGTLFNSRGKQLAHATGPGGALSLGAPHSAKIIFEIWHSICAELKRSPTTCKNVALCAGIAGYGLSGRRTELSGLLSSFANIHMVSDGYGALLAATDGLPGALISVGTGVGALRLDKDNKTLALSGWGFPAGDAGSGAWIGLQVMGDVLKHLDGITLNPALPCELADQILQIIGPDPQTIKEWQIGAKPKDFAAFAPLVIQKSATENIYCKNLLNEAAAKIVRVGRALQNTSNHEIHLGGGLGETLLPYCKKISPDIHWFISKGDPVIGLYLLASGKAPDQELTLRPGLT